MRMRRNQFISSFPPPFFTTYYLLEVGSEAGHALPVIREGIALRERKT
jgi:hypothetical protein